MPIKKMIDFNVAINYNVEKILAVVNPVPYPVKSITTKHVKPPYRAGILLRTL
jgi:hypothetical protein